jgi:chemotaxis signal transduction protein
VSGVAKLDQRLLLLLDVDRIMSVEDSQAVAAAQA